MNAQCVDCGAPIVVDTLATLPSGALSMRKLPGRKRTRCAACQKKYEDKQWYATASARKRKKRAERQRQNGLLM